MAPESAQKSANAVTARHAWGVNSCCEKMTPAKTKRFFAHCRGRSEARTAATSPMARLAQRGAQGGGDLGELGVRQLREAGEGEHLARGARGLWKVGGHLRRPAGRTEERLGGNRVRVVHGSADAELREPAGHLVPAGHPDRKSTRLN